MAMDFFEHQDKARRKTGWLVLLFALAVLLTIAATYVVVTVALGLGNIYDTKPSPILLFDLPTLGIVTGAIILVVGTGSLYRMAQLRGGGESVAELLGGSPINPDSTDASERKVLNVVQEMAIASGMPVPPVFLLKDEHGINAFAAGFSPSDAVIGVTRGCIRRLSRDELQGVVAHEFSHIFNGDMRLNTRLMGVLYGILLIGLIGYHLLRSTYHVSHRSRSGRSGNGIAVLAVGFGLMIVGFIGTFFGKLIKCAVSRQREFLADASAVQFTRNPDGIADALRKIGGCSYGSNLISANAPQASHMFFGEGVYSPLGRLMSTHPKLPERIRRIVASWDGTMLKSVGNKQLPLAPLAVAAGVAGVAHVASTAGTIPLAPRRALPAESALPQIGQPSPAHVTYAQQLMEGLPQQVVTAAQEPHGARAVIYALLISEETEVHRKQLERLASHGDRGIGDETQRLMPHVKSLSGRVRLPLIDLIVPTLRKLTADQYNNFKQNVEALVAADGKIDLFEWLLKRIVLRHLEPHFAPVPKNRVQYYAPKRLEPDCSLLLSALADVGHRDTDMAQQAFAQAAEVLGLPWLTMSPADQCKLSALDRTLDVLLKTSPKVKRSLVQSCVACVSLDQKITVEEAELLRGICDCLDCPMPPILPGQPSTS